MQSQPVSKKLLAHAQAIDWRFATPVTRTTFLLVLFLFLCCFPAPSLSLVVVVLVVILYCKYSLVALARSLDKTRYATTRQTGRLAS